MNRFNGLLFACGSLGVENVLFANRLSLLIDLNCDSHL